MTNLISRKQAAALLGVSPQAIDKARHAGRISYADPEKRLFDPLALEAQWHGNRRRQRTPKAAAAPAVGAPDPARAADSLDPIPRLLHRRLSAETSLAEQKAKVGSGTRIGIEDLGRALSQAHTLGRASLDSYHPKLLDMLDEFCPERDPRYAALYRDTFGLLRHAWADMWATIVQCLGAEQPELRRWFVQFAARENGTNPAPEVRSRLGLPPLP